MKSLKLLKKLRKKHKKGEGISIVIPFKPSKHYKRQAKNFKWVQKYWECQLPGAEIIVGTDPDKKLPFSKSAAVNAGVKKSHGDIIVVADADGYIEIEAVLLCAKRIRKAIRRGHKLWFVPYRQFYRLTDEASQRVLDSKPCDPYVFPEPPNPCDIQNRLGSGRGHWYGAMMQIFPRVAFDIVGGWDTRFRGWGGEDHSAMRAMDTLYAPHKTLPGQILHLWHPMMGKEGHKTGMKSWVTWNKRLWDNQTNPGDNNRLATRYSRANGNRKRMRRLTMEWQEIEDQKLKA